MQCMWTVVKGILELLPSDEQLVLSSLIQSIVLLFLVAIFDNLQYMSEYINVHAIELMWTYM